MGSGFPIDATLGQEESLKCSGTRVRMRVGILSVSEASLDFRKRRFHHTRILSRVPKLHFKGSCSPACSLLPKSIWICSEFVVYARAVCQRSFRHEPKMEGEGGEKYIAKRLWPEKEARPPTTDTLTVIFFHGLQMLDGTDTSETTWKNRSGTVCWPQVWLPEDLGKERVRVLSMSYDSIASCWGIPGQTEDLRAIGSDLVEKFITMSEWKLYENQKIVLVGHSFGGLVIKSLVLEASRKAKLIDRARNKFEKKNFSKCKNFLENIKGMVFYGVPHSGTSIGQYLKDFDRAFPKVQPGDLIRNLQPFQNDMEQLSVDFEEALKPDIISYAFAETLKYKEVLVVPWASATQLTRSNNMTLDANHIDICKPHSKNDAGYSKLVDFLELIMDG